MLDVALEVEGVKRQENHRKNMKKTKNITKHRKRFLEETMGFSEVSLLMEGAALSQRL